MDGMVSEIRARHRAFLQYVTMVRRAVGGHPESPAPDDAVRLIKGLQPHLLHHFAEERDGILGPLAEKDPGLADRLQRSQERILATLARVPEGSAGLSEAHLAALDLRRHMQWVESEALLPLVSRGGLGGEDERRPVAALSVPGRML